MQINELIIPTADEIIWRRQAQEAFWSWMDKQSKYIIKGKYWDPRDNIIAVVTHYGDGMQFFEHPGLIYKEWFFGKNLAVDDGDIYYAKKGAGETPAVNENFLQARMELRNMADTPAKADNYGAVLGPITASRKTIDATYPKTNDTGDTDNTGDAVDAVSYRYQWTAADFNDAAIQGGCQHDNATPVAGTKLLNHFSIPSFAKGSTDTLKIFTNHTFNGI